MCYLVKAEADAQIRRTDQTWLACLDEYMIEQLHDIHPMSDAAVPALYQSCITIKAALSGLSFRVACDALKALWYSWLSDLGALG